MSRSPKFCGQGQVIDPTGDRRLKANRHLPPTKRTFAMPNGQGRVARSDDKRLKSNHWSKA